MYYYNKKIIEIISVFLTYLVGMRLNVIFTIVKLKILAFFIFDLLLISNNRSINIMPLIQQ